MHRGTMQPGPGDQGNPDRKSIMAKTTTTTKPAAVKPAAKPAKPAKPAAAAKTAKTTAKPAKTEDKPAAATKPAATLYAVRPGFRPGSGHLLFAYTMAWLQETGLIDGASIPRAHAVKFAGQSAVQYHTDKTGLFKETAGRVSLAPGAANKFADRRHETDIREAYRGMIRTGTPDGKHVKQNAAFEKIDA